MIEDLYQHPYVLFFTCTGLMVILVIIRNLLLNYKKKPDIAIGNAQAIGKRKQQEDSFSTIVTERGVMAVLADGMGGYSNGAISSNTAVKTFIKEFSRSDATPPFDKFFFNTAKLSNSKVMEKNRGVRSGTTLTAVIIYEGCLYWASVGDSAIVLFRNGEFINLNKKHIFESVLEQKYVSGSITREEMETHSKKKRLTSFIGHEGFNDVEIGREVIKLRHRDKVVLLSDGVYNTLTEIEMEKILMKKSDPLEVSEEIIDLVIKKNSSGQDNATIVILEKN